MARSQSDCLGTPTLSELEPIDVEVPDGGTPVDRVLERLSNVKRSGSGWTACCPAHDDKRPSLSVGIGDDGRVLLRCFAGCSIASIVAAVGLRQQDLFGPSPARANGKAAKHIHSFPTAERAIEALASTLGEPTHEWTYCGANGEPVGVVLRWDDDNGKEIRPVSRTKAGWVIAAMKAPRPLLWLPEIIDEKTVWIVEGEGCADAGKVLGLTVTTWAGGSNAVGLTDWTALANKKVFVLPDSDAPGRRAAEKIATTLTSLDATVKIVELDGLPEHGDLADWTGADGAASCLTEIEIVHRLESLAAKTDPWKPPPEPSLTDTDVPGGGTADVKKSTPATSAIVTKLADVVTKSVEWLWDGRIAIGKLTMIAGNPGLGKSFITLDMASRVSTGRGWPDAPNQPIPAGGVILLSAEDALDDTVKSRLESAQADLSKIIAITGTQQRTDKGGTRRRTFDLGADMPSLERTLDDMDGCRLVVIDPISAYCGGADSHRNTDVRALLEPLADLAARRRVAVACVTHLNKGGQGQNSALHRVMGSLAFTAAARAVWLVLKDKNDDDRRLFLPAKNNLARTGNGLAYRLVNDLGCLARVSWEPDTIDIDVDDAIAEPRGNSRKLNQAIEFLETELANGPVVRDDVIAAADAQGITERTLKRAREQLKIVCNRDGFGKGAVYSWRLPDDGLV